MNDRMNEQISGPLPTAVQDTDASPGNDRFYADLPAFTGLDGMTDERHYRAAPTDWLVFVTDVRGSTAAVAAGRYKEVNTIGAATIVAAANACAGTDFPFVFGGDGATLLVPPSVRDSVARALLFLARKSQDDFGLPLRVGCVPVAEVVARGKPVRVARRELSPGNCIAMFAGGGLNEATAMIKAPDGRWLLADDPQGEGSVEGLECRWCAVPARHGTVLSLMVWAPGEHLALYGQLLSAILQIAPNAMPVTPQNLPTRWPPEFLMHEAKMKQQGRFMQWLHYAGVSLLTALLTVIVKLTRGDPASAAAVYISSLCRNNDYLKIDDYLRMVIDVTDAQRERITALLDSFSANHGLAWGMHGSRASLFTCMVRSQQEHLHFIDGDDGGYTAAALDMARRAGQIK